MSNDLSTPSARKRRRWPPLVMGTLVVISLALILGSGDPNNTRPNGHAVWMVTVGVILFICNGFAILVWAVWPALVGEVRRAPRRYWWWTAGMALAALPLGLGLRHFTGSTYSAGLLGGLVFDWAGLRFIVGIWAQKHPAPIKWPAMPPQR